MEKWKCWGEKLKIMKMRDEKKFIFSHIQHLAIVFCVWNSSASAPLSFFPFFDAPLAPPPAPSLILHKITILPLPPPLLLPRPIFYHRPLDLTRTLSALFALLSQFSPSVSLFVCFSVTPSITDF